MSGDEAVRLSEEEREALLVAAHLRRLAADSRLLWEVARRAIEDELIEWRDARRSMPLRNNGLVVKERDGAPSDVIRFGPEIGVGIALGALADHIERAARVQGGEG